MSRVILLVILLLGTSGCAIIHPPVPVHGEPAFVALLDGEWEGFYTSDDTGRSGGIFFDLVSDADSAVGEVVMYAPGRYDATNPSAREGRARYEATHSSVLTISFVRTEGRLVSGSLRPYTDPACGCTLSTTFVGEMDGDRIEGTFVSFSHEHSHTNRGTWEVIRKGPGR